MINDIITGLGVTELLNPEITLFSERSLFDRSGSSTSSRTGSSTSSSSTTATDGSVYTLPDGKLYTMTKAQYDAFHKVYGEAYRYAYSKNIKSPQVEDVLKYGQIVADWYKDGKVFTEADYLASQTQTYTIALPNGQIARNLTQTQYDTVKALLDMYNEAFALSKENGLPVPSWDSYDTMSNAQNALAKLKAQIQAAPEAAAAANALESEYLELCQTANKYGIINLPTFTQYQKLSVSDRNILKNDYLRISIASYGLVDTPGWSDFLKLSDSERAGISNAVTPPEVVLPDIVPTVQPYEDKQGRSFPWLAVAIFGAISIGAIALVKSKPKERR